MIVLQIVIRDGVGTRWMVPAEMVADQIQILAQSVAKVNTSGTVPSVTVSQERPACVLCEQKRAVGK